MSKTSEPERFPVVVIGAGQAGLSVGYHLARQGIPFVILDANERVGDSWRNRWDSLRLFTPARYDGLDGMPFPAPRNSFPTRGEMGDYLETYAKTFGLPVRTGVRVDRVSRRSTTRTFLIETNRGLIEAEQVIVAMANYQKGRVPTFASLLDPHVVQMHSIDYRRPSQLRDGPVLLVGAGNSAAEIGIELVRHGHRTIISGRKVGEVPQSIGSFVGQNIVGPILTRIIFHRLLTTDTRLGRKARGNGKPHTAPLIRTKWKDLENAGVEHVGRTDGIRNGMPMLEDGQVLDVANVIWCTGFEPGFSWIDLPVFAETGWPMHARGVSTEDGLYFVGLAFLYAMSSSMVHGVGRDAQYVVNAVAERVRATRPVPSRTSGRSERVSGSRLRTA